MQQDQDFVHILESMQDDQYIFIRKYGIHQKVYSFTFLYHDRIFSVNQRQIILYLKFIYGFATE